MIYCKSVSEGLDAEYGKKSLFQSGNVSVDNLWVGGGALPRQRAFAARFPAVWYDLGWHYAA
jgi:hypothetical protein